MKKKELGLDFVWKIRLQLWAEGNKLRAEGDKFWAEGDKLRAEGDKLRTGGNMLRAEGDKLRTGGNMLRAEGDKLRAEGNKLWAEGDKLWAEAILEVYGNIKLEWIWTEGSIYNCKLETGEEFKG